MNYCNYHRHSYFSNIVVPDVTVSNEDYAKRAVELGQGLICSCEHGWTGRYIETFELAKKYNLKFLFGTETYIVKNRYEKDKTNAHIILLAKNENGRKAINRILSEANLTGFYYRARIDMELLLSLPKNDVWLTSACIAGLWKYEDWEDLFLQIHNHFGNNFFLEVQNHNTQSQKDLNARIINFSNKNNIQIIFGCDSHYIYPEQSINRDDYLLSKHIIYEDEEGWYMDYPSCDEVVFRFKEQGILNSEQIKMAIENTNIFLSVEEYDSPVFTKKLKLPTLYPNKTQEEKDNILINLVWSQWEIEKKNIDGLKWNKYKEEIQKELNIVIETKMADYFLLDYQVIKRGKEIGGHITMTGRGSASSFFLCKLLGFTTVDRISASVKLFPERFMTKERILEAGSLPDIDANLGNPEVFAQAQIDILGEDHSYPMIAYGTLRPKAAWKLYARAKNINFETANMVSDQISNYEIDLKHTNEEDKESISPLNYINKEYQQLYLESEKYLGIVSDAKIHPCAYLLCNEFIKEEIGIIKVKENMCCIMDGLWAENYKFLKNDLLKVAVVDLIYKIYERIGIDPHPLPKLIELCKNNQKVWDVYKNAWTVGVNQAEQINSAIRVAKYKPTNISELSAWIAGIRPGFQSNYKQFEARESFSYGIPSLDSLIQTEEFPQSYMLYQENAMQVMAYAGIPISQTYEVVKNIAKKRVEKVMKYKDIFISGMTKKIMKSENKNQEESDRVANMTWKIIEDSSKYSFNSCVSGETIIQKAGGNGNFTPTIEEMYLIMNDIEYAKNTGHFDLHNKYNYHGYGNALSMFPDGRVRKNNIAGIYKKGIQDTYKISLENGANLICTNNHKFPSPVGEKKLSQLNIGDYLYTKGSYEKNNKKVNFTDGNFINNFPQKGQQGFQKNEEGPSVVYHSFKEKNEYLQNNCEICGKEYSKKERFEVHHKDGNHLNNVMNNFCWCCVSCHKKQHYSMGRKKVFEKGLSTVLNRIISIEYIGKQVVYDIEMESPAHNFITNSGLITSNSHAYCYAGDSLYGAYLKSHYPLFFYETFLQMMEEDGDKDRLLLAKSEAETAFKINFPKFQFGQDNRKIVAVPEKNEINQSLKSIKGFGSKVAEDMYFLYQNFKGNDFCDFLIFADENNLINSKFESLLKIGYFDNFGPDKMLYDFYLEFTNGKNRYSSKLTDKSKNKRLPELRNNLLFAKNESFSIQEKISYEFDILGNIQSKFNVNNKYVLILSIEDKGYYSNIEIQTLKSNAQRKLKISKKIISEHPFIEGSILLCKDFRKSEDKRKDHETGEKIGLGTFSWWLESYYVMKKSDEFIIS